MVFPQQLIHILVFLIPVPRCFTFRYHVIRRVSERTDDRLTCVHTVILIAFTFHEFCEKRSQSIKAIPNGGFCVSQFLKWNSGIKEVMRGSIEIWSKKSVSVPVNYFDYWIWIRDRIIYDNAGENTGNTTHILSFGLHWIVRYLRSKYLPDFIVL